VAVPFVPLQSGRGVTWTEYGTHEPDLAAYDFCPVCQEVPGYCRCKRRTNKAPTNGARRPATSSDADGTSPQPRLADQLLTIAGLATLPPARPLVDGLLYRRSLAQLSGPPGSYKSFVAIGLAVCTALGEAFEDHRVPESGAVIYVAAEGATGLRKRILAYRELGGYDPARLHNQLYVLPVPVQLGRPFSVGEALDMVTETGAKLLILDTRARCTLGLDENSATEQGLAIDAVERLIDTTGCTTLALHHSGRSGSAGRGSTAWDGAVWSDLRVTSEGLICTVECSKHKDVPDGCGHPFRMVPHTVSEALMPGCSRSERETLVIIRADGRPAEVDHKTGRIVRAIVRACAGPEGLTRAEIRDMAIAQGVGRTQAYAAINDLITRGVLINVSPTTKERFRLAPAYADPRSDD
jgi:hypothetical protein